MALIAVIDAQKMNERVIFNLYVCGPAPISRTLATACLAAISMLADAVNPASRQI